MTLNTTLNTNDERESEVKFLLYAIVGTVVSVVLSYVMARRKRQYFFGWLAICGGLGIAAYNGLQNPSVNDFVSCEIQYVYCFYDKDNGDVVLGSETEKYYIIRAIYQNMYSGQVIADRLASRSKAAVWKHPNSKLIKGIKTDNLYLPPENALKWEREGNRQLCWLGICFAIGGLVIVGLIKLGEILFGSRKL